MSEDSSATTFPGRPLPRFVVPARPGLSWGFLGVLAFSFTVPLTRLAVGSGHLSSLFVGSDRAVVAALLAGLALWFSQSPRPRGREWIGVGVVAAGAVLGFPLLTSIALTQTPASHGAVVIALLPATTAIVSVVRTGERPGRVFWVASAVGAVAAVLFARGPGKYSRTAAGRRRPAVRSRDRLCPCLRRGRDPVPPPRSLADDLLGAARCRAGDHPPHRMGGRRPAADRNAGGVARLRLPGVVSMFLGFVAWYRGLAIGPLARRSARSSSPSP